jgi:YggT family protein
MFVLSNFLTALATVIGVVLNLLWWLIVIRALLSWVSPDPYNPIVQFIERTTEPVLAPFRRIVPMHSIGIDLSPLFAILLIYFLKIFLVQTILGFAARLG